MTVERPTEPISKAIKELLPPEAQLAKVDFEGPEIAIYVKNPQFVIEGENVIKQIAKTIKKRIVVRTDTSIRKPRGDAIKKILEIVPQEAGITENDIEFDEVLGEVIIKAVEPRYVYGKERSLYKKIFVETGWRPRIIRKPPLESRLLKSIHAYLLSESDTRRKVLQLIGEKLHKDVVFKDHYIRITALGGFMEVGRSAILIETTESKILLDFGFNPSASLPQQMYPRVDLIDMNFEDLDAVVVTHAHLDHCGLVPFLFKYGYKGPVYITEATRDLMTLLQLDLLDIASREGKPLPYTLREVKEALLHTIPLKYGEVTDIAPDIRLTFYEAGHILGSAIAHIHIGNGLHNIVYTSDFKYAKTKLLDKAHTEFPRVDTLIIEATYGGTEQPPREESERRLIELVNKTIKRKGKVLIPTLSVGRAQEVMLILSEAMNKKLIPEVPVFIEGMINEVTAIHVTYPELLSREVREKIYRGENPFTYPAFKIVEDRSARKDIVESPEPAIIMATSGMLSGGPAVEYFKMLAEDSKNMLIFVNYQVEGTLGRKIKDGLRDVQLFNEGRLEIIKVNMEVHSIEGFSGHSDRNQLLKYIADLTPKPRKIVLNHGEPENINALREKILRYKIRLGLPRDVEIYTPRLLDAITLVI